MSNLRRAVRLGLFSAAFAINACAAELELPPLIEKESDHLPGKFIWADLVTDDAARAMRFYAQLFNWRFKPVGNYFVVFNESRPIAGIFQKTIPSNASKARARWFGYISVPSVSKAEAKVIESGGKVIAPRRALPKRGEQAVFADPEGAIFGVMKSRWGDPQDFSATPNDWIWIQLLSRNARQASEFYRKIGGYDVVESSKTNRVNDYVLASSGFARATIRTLLTPGSEINPTWLPYIRVEDVKEMAMRATQFQGKVLIEPRPDLFDGKVAVIADPSGGAVGILEWTPEIAKAKERK